MDWEAPSSHSSMETWKHTNAHTTQNQTNQPTNKTNKTPKAGWATSTGKQSKIKSNQVNFQSRKSCHQYGKKFMPFSLSLSLHCLQHNKIRRFGGCWSPLKSEGTKQALLQCSNLSRDCLKFWSLFCLTQIPGMIRNGYCLWKLPEDYRSADTWSERLLMETSKGQCRPPKEARVRFLGKLQHVKEAVYMGELRKPHSCPGKIHTQEKKKKGDLQFSSWAYPWIQSMPS